MASSILTPHQKHFLDVYSESEISKYFYFSGGTALSHYYLQHRLSEDLDFFSETEFEVEPITIFIASTKKHMGYEAYDLQSSFNRNIYQLRFTDGQFLKIEFTYYPFSQIEPPLNKDGVMVDSIIDIAANKLFTIAQKPRGRDYVDLYTINRKCAYSIEDLRIKAKTKFDWHVDPLQLGTQFNLVDTLLDDPILVASQKIEKAQVIEYFKFEAQQLKKHVLV